MNADLISTGIAASLLGIAGYGLAALPLSAFGFRMGSGLGFAIIGSFTIGAVWGAAV